MGCAMLLYQSAQGECEMRKTKLRFDKKLWKKFLTNRKQCGNISKRSNECAGKNRNVPCKLKKRCWQWGFYVVLCGSCFESSTKHRKPQKRIWKKFLTNGRSCVKINEFRAEFERAMKPVLKTVKNRNVPCKLNNVNMTKKHLGQFLIKLFLKIK